MAKNSNPVSQHDIEKGHHHHHLSSVDSDEGSFCFSDAQDHAWPSPSCAGSSHDDHRASFASSHEIDGVQEQQRKSCELESSVEDDLESGISKNERICRICHLCLEKATPEYGIPIVLGCSCKDDLAAAHKQCAETWFKIRGNKTCEICGSTAQNVFTSAESEMIEQWDDINASVVPATHSTETRRFWQGHRFLNFLLACLVFAFVISWLFHFTTPG